MTNFSILNDRYTHRFLNISVIIYDCQILSTVWLGPEDPCAREIFRTETGRLFH